MKKFLKKIFFVGIVKNLNFMILVLLFGTGAILSCAEKIKAASITKSSVKVTQSSVPEYDNQVVLNDGDCYFSERRVKIGVAEHQGKDRIDPECEKRKALLVAPKGTEVHQLAVWCDLSAVKSTLGDQCFNTNRNTVRDIVENTRVMQANKEPEFCNQAKPKILRHPIKGSLVRIKHFIKRC